MPVKSLDKAKIFKITLSTFCCKHYKIIELLLSKDIFKPMEFKRRNKCSINIILFLLLSCSRLWRVMLITTRLLLSTGLSLATRLLIATQ